MSSSRREFVKSVSTAAALALAQRVVPYGTGLVPVLSPPGSTPGDPAFRDLAMRALDAAKSAGATYADVRIQDWTLQWIVVDTGSIKKVILKDDVRFSVRVIAGGAWGFASTSRLVADDAERAARIAVAQAKANSAGQRAPVALAPAPPVANGAYTTPIRQDPFAVPIESTLDLIVSAHERVGKGKPGENLSVGTDHKFLRDTTSFASSEGAWIVQTLYGARLGDVYAVVVSPDHTEGYFLRLPTNVPVAAGYEALTELHLADAYPPLVEDTRRMMTAKEADVGRFDVVFDAHAVAGLIGASLSPALELDRVLGTEQEVGTSYLAPPEKILGAFRVGSPALTLRADRTTPRGLGTAGWDSEGVATDAFTLIKNGVVVDYLTDRSLAPHLAAWYAKTNRQVSSHGCLGQDHVGHIPVIWEPNLTMEPSAHGGSLESLIASTQKGLYVTGPLFGLLDAPMMNGLYGGGTGNMMREIKNGKLGEPVKHGAVVARTTDLWQAIDAVGGPASVSPYFGMFSKGNPNENGATTITAPAVRMKQLNVVNLYRKERSAST